MSVKISTDEWLAELDRIFKESGDIQGLTMREIATHLNLSVDHTQERIRKAVYSGQWKFVGYKRSPSIDGRISKIPVYAPVKKGTQNENHS